MKVLITGGAGYIGSELTKELVKDKKIKEIIIYDNLSIKNYNLFTTPSVNKEKVRLIQGELLDSRKLNEVLDGIEIVYHLAAYQNNLSISIPDSQLYEQTNNWGTAELVYAVCKKDVKKFVYVSTVDVYGFHKEMITAQTSLQPSSYFAISKQRGEGHMELLFDKIQTYVLRCADVYGIGISTNFNAPVNRLIFDAHFKNKISINGAGKHYHSIVHLDTITGVLSKIVSSNLESGYFNVTDQNFTTLQIAEKLKEIYPKMEMIFTDHHINHGDSRVDRDSRLEKIISPSMELTKEFLQIKVLFS